MLATIFLIIWFIVGFLGVAYLSYKSNGKLYLFDFVISLLASCLGIIPWFYVIQFKLSNKEK